MSRAIVAGGPVSWCVGSGQGLCVNLEGKRAPATVVLWALAAAGQGAKRTRSNRHNGSHVCKGLGCIPLTQRGGGQPRPAEARPAAQANSCKQGTPPKNARAPTMARFAPKSCSGPPDRSARLCRRFGRLRIPARLLCLPSCVQHSRRAIWRLLTPQALDGLTKSHPPIHHNPSTGCWLLNAPVVSFDLDRSIQQQQQQPARTEGGGEGCGGLLALPLLAAAAAGVDNNNNSQGTEQEEEEAAAACRRCQVCHCCCSSCCSWPAACTAWRRPPSGRARRRGPTGRGVHIAQVFLESMHGWMKHCGARSIDLGRTIDRQPTPPDRSRPIPPPTSPHTPQPTQKKGFTTCWGWTSRRRRRTSPRRTAARP